MGQGSRWATITLLLGCVGGLAACGGGADAPPVPAERAQQYDPSAPIEARRTGRQNEGTLRVTKITYRAPGGDRVPALLAVPTHAEPLGCVLYQGDLGVPKETAAELRQGFAVARLATFSIDPQNVGQRGTAEELGAAIARPESLGTLLLDTVAELRTAVGYLSRRRECRGRIAYVGTAFGGIVGTMLAAQDRRVDTALLTSFGATFKQRLLVRPIAAERIPNLPNYVPEAAADLEVLDHAVEVLSPYDPVKWIGRIAPRPVMIMNGRFDPVVLPGDAMELSAAAKRPKTVLFFDGGHDPFADGPAREANLARAGRFLVETLDLPFPTSG